MIWVTVICAAFVALASYYDSMTFVALVVGWYCGTVSTLFSNYIRGRS